ncbi:hypothetical protein JTE90_018507 [Oedothorax gibbosus]|uniref:Uncharacterized protein n=1 Tax=Oedothorax gibbosus TaxID=931172 RepID=A0AAV6UYS2_9ARAC|nr:hypothetical protein JTE90_018507 [Oedothorax gibbosus]
MGVPSMGWRHGAHRSLPPPPLGPLKKKKGVGGHFSASHGLRSSCASSGSIPEDGEQIEVLGRASFRAGRSGFFKAL